MIPVLRPYQNDVKYETYEAWSQGYINVLIALATGGGKTVVVSDIVRENIGACVVIAHRSELVGQLSLALAQQGIYHNIIASREVVKFIASIHVQMIGRSFFHPQAPVTCAGVDTLIRRDLGSWAKQVTLWVQDEGHHVQVNNKWGIAAAMFPNARGLTVTASPFRADGKGLGRHATGLIDYMVEGPRTRELINMGMLSDYRMFEPPSDLDLSNVPLSATTGDYSLNKLRTATHNSTITGDIVEQYIRLACGKLGITFAVDVIEAKIIAEKYREFGIPAQVITGNTPANLRNELVTRFRNREILQLVNVDIFGEGFDCPGVEVVSQGRGTASKGLYWQQAGRMLRLDDGKTHGFLIDHVGNRVRHGLIDEPMVFTLDAREKGARRAKDDTIDPMKVCTECMSPYLKIEKCCPYCGHYLEPAERSRPDQVDGNLFELSKEAMAALRGEISSANENLDNMRTRLMHGGLSDVIVNTQVKLKREQHEVLNELTTNINWWGAKNEAQGLAREQAYKQFYLTFGIDVLSAQALSKVNAKILNDKIVRQL